jgi:hypothetical protein
VWFYSSGKGKKEVRNRLRVLEAARRGDITEDEPSSVGFKRLAVQERDHEAWIGEVIKAVAGTAS